MQTDLDLADDRDIVHGLATRRVAQTLHPLLYSRATPVASPSTLTFYHNHNTTGIRPPPCSLRTEKVYRAYALTMLMLPAAIVALLFYLIVGPLTVSQRFQTGFKSLGQGIHQTFSSVLSLPHSTFEPQVLPVVFDATAAEVLPIAPVETFATHSVEIASPFPVPSEDYAEVVVPEVPLLQHDDKPSPTPTQVFVVPSGFPSSFCLCDLFSYRFLVIFISFWFPFVAIALVTKLPSPTEPHRDTKPRINEPLPKLLPPKILTPARAVQVLIENRNSDTPLEPVFSSASPEPPTFWLASEYPMSSPIPAQSNIPISKTKPTRPAIFPLSSPPPFGHLL